MATRYRLLIEQVMDNESYDAEMKAWSERRQYMPPQFDELAAGPSRERVIKALSVTVTDVEFAAIKKAALAVMA